MAREKEKQARVAGPRRAHLDCVDKLGVVPSVDLARAPHKRGVWEEGADLWQQGPVGAVCSRGVRGSGWGPG